jgi:FkbM family methyltransferase
MSAALEGTGAIAVVIAGKQVEFRYPDSEVMRNVVLGVFQGNEYPLVGAAGYAPSTIVDVGANVGATALLFHNSFPGAQIHCYEPSMDNLPCLWENTEPFQENIQVHAYGLLDRDCELPLYRGTSQPAQNSLAAGGETATDAAEHVQIVDVSREIAERGWKSISILKLDTEGCEVPILAGFLRAVEHIDIFYCEYHAEEDRRRIDAMVAGRFSLCFAKAERVHRGNCVYLSRDFLARHPGFEAQPIVVTPR